MTDIVTSPIASYTPVSVDSGLMPVGPAACLDFAADIINALSSRADTKSAQFDTSVDALTNAATGWLATHGVTDITAPNVTITAPTEPNITPVALTTATVFSNFSTQTQAIITDLASEFTSFYNTHFAGDNTNYADAEAWIATQIGNTSSGSIPSSIRAAILEDQRLQVVSEQTRALDSLYAQGVSRRHRFPPGVLAANTKAIAQSALDQTAAGARAIMIKDFDVTVQQILQAVQLAVSSRAAAFSAVREYLSTALVAAYNQGAQVTQAAHAAEQGMIQSGANWFNARISAADLSLKTITTDKQLEFNSDKANQEKDIGEREEYLKAFMTHAQLISQQLISLLNNIRTGADVAYRVSV